MISAGQVTGYNLLHTVHAILPEPFGKGIGIDLQFSYLNKTWRGRLLLKYC